MRVRKSKHQDKIYEVIRGVGIHMSAEEVWHEVKKIDETVGIATVYRQLNNLVEQHKIARISNRDQGYTYDGNPEEHHHFYCTQCGSYYDISMKLDHKIHELIEDEIGATVTAHSMIFEGICRHCSQN